MSQETQIKLNPSCILNVPLQTYDDDFTFIVNGEEIKTSRLISDLLSQKICQNHINDPTYDTFILNTQSRGTFSHLLNLLTFKTTTIPENEVPFICEAIEKLCNDSIEITDNTSIDEITTDNVLSLIQCHEQYPRFHCQRLSKEIEFASENFHDLYSEHKEQLKLLTIESLHSIFKHPNFQVENEDEVIEFINELYKTDKKHVYLYEHVFFENLSVGSACSFVDLFLIDDIGSCVWKAICRRLTQEVVQKESDNCKRYKENKNQGTIFNRENGKDFSGIINHLRSKSNIENEINFTSSGNYSNSGSLLARSVSLFEDEGRYFYSAKSPNSWICLDFKDHRVIPTAYTIRTRHCGTNDRHLKSWILEGSKDNDSWKTLDEQNDCSHLNGNRFFHTFNINQNNTEEYKYLRIKQTGPNWNNDNYLIIDSFELYGTLI
ncbi:hypothetical protein M9Y10_030402 [Tritrichomonas musculus]|uniref:F5/8 type C domain-containing protein n=1 Tax=Tritrichomonas musculus TaxID=1915356 RepID=A0ABR2H339_9EUKA